MFYFPAKRIWPIFLFSSYIIYFLYRLLLSALSLLLYFTLLYFTLLHTIFFFLVFSLLSLNCFLSTSDFSLGFSTFISLLSLSPIRSAMLLSLQYNKMLNSSPFFPSHFSFLFGCCPFFSLKTILSLLFLPRVCNVKTKKASTSKSYKSQNSDSFSSHNKFCIYKPVVNGGTEIK